MLFDQGDDGGRGEATGCKTQSKVGVVLEKCTRDLPVFERVSWSVGKESWFTKPLTKLHSVKDEASQVDNTDIVERRSSRVSVLTNAKCFVSLHRQYENVQTRLPTLVEFASALLPMI